MLKAVIFDIDGTLIDSVDLHARAWVKAFEKYGYQIPFEQLRQQIGKGSEQIIPEFISQEAFERLGAKIADYRKQYYQENLLSKAKPFEKVPELFERLKQDGLKIVLASSAKEDTIAYYKEKLGIENLIEAATSTDDVEKSKPHPDIFKAALEKLDGVKPEEAIAVGDSPYDAEAAGKISLRTVGVLCGGFSEIVLREAGCIAIYRDPADLLANYERSPLSSVV
ncbi:HAD family phosphatase [Pleurocapsales cyanobacterium LEGE 06147]|nr:HAD family phosphatase [Pleurocapsales cyanobacterium LEGE 06147]